MTIPSPSQLRELTARTASHRPTSDPDTFMQQYSWWTARADQLDSLEGTPAPTGIVDEAAQIEGYAAARRRAAYCHFGLCPCDACKVRRIGAGAVRTRTLHAA